MSKLAKANCFRNFIGNQVGNRVVVRMIGGRIVEGKAVHYHCSDGNLDGYIEEKDGGLVAPINECDVDAFWPKYARGWIDAEEFGDDVYFDLSGKAKWEFLMPDPDEEDIYALDAEEV